MYCTVLYPTLLYSTLRYCTVLLDVLIGIFWKISFIVTIFSIFEIPDEDFEV